MNPFFFFVPKIYLYIEPNISRFTNTSPEPGRHYVSEPCGYAVAHVPALVLRIPTLLRAVQMKLTVDPGLTLCSLGSSTVTSMALEGAAVQKRWEPSILQSIWLFMALLSILWKKQHLATFRHLSLVTIQATHFKAKQLQSRLFKRCMLNYSHWQNCLKQSQVPWNSCLTVFPGL